jgi:hypothetical protein
MASNKITIKGKTNQKPQIAINKVKSKAEIPRKSFSTPMDFDLSKEKGDIKAKKKV